MFDPHEALCFKELKQKTVYVGKREYSFGKKNVLAEHIKMLELEFSGKTQLELLHAETIVFLRRGIDAEPCLQRFKDMWIKEGEFLTSSLDSRWLVSACDTIIDYFDDAIEVRTAAAAVLLMNTIKLYETESHALGISGPGRENLYSPITSRVPLFDGMSAFVIGYGDMVANMFERIRKVADVDKISAMILSELLRRTLIFDTVYKRFGSIHVNPDTNWLSEFNPEK